MPNLQLTSLQFLVHSGVINYLRCLNALVLTFVPLSDGTEQIKLPVGQVDFSKVF